MPYVAPPKRAIAPKRTSRARKTALRKIQYGSPIAPAVIPATSNVGFGGAESANNTTNARQGCSSWRWTQR